MKTRYVIILFVTVFATYCAKDYVPEKPPLAEVKPVEDEYYGIKITDRIGTWKILKILKLSNGSELRRIMPDRF